MPDICIKTKIICCQQNVRVPLSLLSNMNPSLTTGFCCYTTLIRMEFVLTSMYHDLLIGLLAIIILK